MALVGKKTRKRVRKFFKQHGDAIVTGLIGSGLTALATRYADEDSEIRRMIDKYLDGTDDRRKKSNKKSRSESATVS